jgi:hypothetical protein
VPEWLKNLFFRRFYDLTISGKCERSDFMEKSLVLSVSARPGCYRHIQISEGATLLKLSSAILNFFDFFDDHLHSFFMSNHAWDQDSEYACPGGDLPGDRVRGSSDKAKLSKFQLSKGDKFLYIFDYGDEWRFQIRVLRVIEETTKIPLVLKSVGKVNQYGYDAEPAFSHQ